MILRRLLLTLIATAAFFAATAQHKAPQIVAHRGYHQKGGAPNNSIEALKMARKLGMKLMAWTVNNPEHIQWLIDQGFDYILTDDPVMMREVLKNSRK